MSYRCEDCLFEDVNEALAAFCADGELSQLTFWELSFHFPPVPNARHAMELTDDERKQLTEAVLTDMRAATGGFHGDRTVESVYEEDLEPLWAELARMYPSFNTWAELGDDGDDDRCPCSEARDALARAAEIGELEELPDEELSGVDVPTVDILRGMALARDAAEKAAEIAELEKLLAEES